MPMHDDPFILKCLGPEFPATRKRQEAGSIWHPLKSPTPYFDNYGNGLAVVRETARELQMKKGVATSRRGTKRRLYSTFRMGATHRAYHVMALPEGRGGLSLGYYGNLDEARNYMHQLCRATDSQPDYLDILLSARVSGVN